jgi:FixJ family two-component response regulator
VETFPSAEEFLSRDRFDGVGCIVLDVQMQGLSGLDLQAELSKAEYSMPIVFITGHGDIPMSVEAMRKGAIHFLTKPLDDNDLLKAIREAIEKDRKAKAEQAEIHDLCNRLNLLTHREYEIFRYVISGMLNKQIGFQLNIAEKTVKIHRGRVMEKLRVDSVAELVRLAEKTDIAPLKK